MTPHKQSRRIMYIPYLTQFWLGLLSYAIAWLPSLTQVLVSSVSHKPLYRTEFVNWPNLRWPAAPPTIAPPTTARTRPTP